MPISMIAKSFLLFSDVIIISPLLIVGFLSRGGFFIRQPSHNGEVIWGHASLLVLFTMIFNVLLKSLFLVPLNPALGIKGYAFPSGHMQVAFVFYGWLAITYVNWGWRVIVTLILTGIGFGLIQQGYHTLEDVIGAFIFGIVSLVLYVKVNSVPRLKITPTQISFYLVLISTFMMGVTALRIGLKANVIKTLMGLVAFSLFWPILNKTIWKQQ